MTKPRRRLATAAEIYEELRKIIPDLPGVSACNVESLSLSVGAGNPPMVTLRMYVGNPPVPPVVTKRFTLVPHPYVAGNGKQ